MIIKMKIIGICSGTSTEWLFAHWNLDRISIWKCWFLRRGENRSIRRKTSRSREEKQQQTQSTNCVESELENRSRATSVGGECHPLLPMIKVHSVGFNDYVWALILMISPWSSYKNKHTHRGVVPWWNSGWGHTWAFFTIVNESLPW